MSRKPGVLALATMVAVGCSLNVSSNGTTGPAPTADAGADAGSSETTIQLLTLAGWNGQLEPTTSTSSAGDTVQKGGLPLLASYFNRDRAEVPLTLPVMSGDSFGISAALSSYFGEVPAIEAMNYLGIVADTIGKHPFNLGTVKLTELYPKAKFTTVTTNLANVAENIGGDLIKTPYHIVEIGEGGTKVKVAFLGIYNQDLAQSIFPGKMGTITIREPVSAASAAAREARAAGANVVVGLTTMDANRETSAGLVGQLADFARKVEGVDVLVGRAYRPTEVAEKVNGTLVVTPLQYGNSYGRVRIKLERNVVRDATAEIIPVLGSGVEPDTGANELLAKYRAELQLAFDKVVTEGGKSLSNSNALLQSIPLGNYIADAMLDRYKPNGAQIALMNGGGIRSGLPSSYKPADTSLRRSGAPYDLVVGDIYTVLPFSNRCVVRTITGDLLWQVLEHSVYLMPQGRGRFLQIAGIKYSWKESASPSARVESITLPDGTTVTRNIKENDPVEYAKFATREFTVVLNDYNNTGGDGYAMLQEEVPSPPADLLTDVMMEYVKTHPVADADVVERITKIP